MLEIWLQGPPRAMRDGCPVDDVRGTKAWALLAHLLLSRTPVSRRRLGALLFPDAVDPAAALRWNLSQLRRGLGLGLEGDPVVLTLPASARVDVEVMTGIDVVDACDVALDAAPLLDGVTVGSEGDEFDRWLDGERRHLDGIRSDVLREAALGRLSRGDPAGAVPLATRVLELDPYDENAAVLLVRALSEAGDAGRAREVAETVTLRLRQELGTDPTSALWSAAHASPGRTLLTGGRPVVQAQLEAGEAALAAGVPDAGVDALREAVGGARALDDLPLLATTLTALGSALVHAVRGTDQDALVLLHEAVAAAAASDLPATGARASRELGYVDLLRGRYERAAHWFDSATALAVDDEGRAWTTGYAGGARTDVGDHAGAGALLDEAVGRAEAGGSLQAAAMAYTWRGRLRMLQDDDSGAVADLDVAIDIGRRLAWRSFLPWPQTLHADVLRRRGDADVALAALQAVLATSRQVGDPCWESAALRGLGLATVARGRLAEGLELLEDAPRQCRRLPDSYLWIELWGVDALADVGSAHGLEQADGWITSLERASSRHGMGSLHRNVARYRAR